MRWMERGQTYIQGQTFTNTNNNLFLPFRMFIADILRFFHLKNKKIIFLHLLHSMFIVQLLHLHDSAMITCCITVLLVSSNPKLLCNLNRVQCKAANSIISRGCNEVEWSNEPPGLFDSKVQVWVGFCIAFRFIITIIKWFGTLP